MHFFGPPGGKRLLGEAMSLGVERVPFPIDIEEVKPGDCLKRGEYEIEVFDTAHGRYSVGFALVEHERLGRFDPEKAREFGVPEGPLWGQLHRGETVQLPDGGTVGPAELVGEARPGRKVVYSGDTAPCEDVVRASEGADLLIHEATFDVTEQDRARDTGHSTAQDAAKVALAAGAKSLVLNHISARYSRDVSVLRDEARDVFPNARVAKDGMLIEVPFAGEPAPA